MKTVALTDRLAPNVRCLFTELDDGTAVLLHMDTKFYYTLNPTGVAVWKHLGAGEPSVDDVAANIERDFEVELDAARRDVVSVLRELLEEGLVALR